MTNSGMNSSVESMAHTHTGVRASIRMPGHDTALVWRTPPPSLIPFYFYFHLLTSHLPPPVSFKKFFFLSSLKAEKSKLRLNASIAATAAKPISPKVCPHTVGFERGNILGFLVYSPRISFLFKFTDRKSELTQGGILLSGKTSAKLFVSLKIFFLDVTIKRAL